MVEMPVPEGGQNDWRTQAILDLQKKSTFWPLFDPYSKRYDRPVDPSDEFENEFRTHFEFELISEQKILQQIIQIFLISNSFQMSSELILGKAPDSAEDNSNILNFELISN